MPTITVLGLTNAIAGQGSIPTYETSEDGLFSRKRGSRWEWRARMSAPVQTLADRIAERQAQRKLEIRHKLREQMSQQRDESLTTNFTNFLQRKDYEQQMKEQRDEWARQAAMMAPNEEEEEGEEEEEELAEAEAEEQDEETQIPEELLQALDDDPSTSFVTRASSQQSPSQSTHTPQSEEEFLFDESEDEAFEELCRRMENI